MGPSWTDIMQTVIAAFGIPFSVIGIYKLLEKDKQKEEQIIKLSNIADQLAEIQGYSERKYQSLKKPKIEIFVENSIDHRILTLDFENTNENSSIEKCVVCNHYDFKQANCSLIRDDKGKQIFEITIVSDEPLGYFDLILLEYTTDEGFRYEQTVSVFLEGQEYKTIQSIVSSI